MRTVRLIYIDHSDLSEMSPRELRAAADEKLLSLAFGRDYGKIEKNEFGKPFLSGEDGRHFSISHAKGGSVIGVSDTELGVDIEEISEMSGRRLKINDDIAGQYFSEEYKKQYLMAKEERKNEVFALCWTATEAMLKAAGTGFHADPRNNPQVYEGWKVKSFLHRGYAVSVAMREDFEIVKDRNE